MFDETIKTLKELRQFADHLTVSNRRGSLEWEGLDPRVAQELTALKNLSEKDLLVACCLGAGAKNPNLDEQSRIAPALFFQPHSGLIKYKLEKKPGNEAQLHSEMYEQIKGSPVFKAFRYIKTVTPLRRPTTSYGAMLKFIDAQIDRETGLPKDPALATGDVRVHMPDVCSNVVLNRSFMIDWQDRLFQDSVLVRFEDGKLNPKATFTALAAFLDIPYTDSLTYCSDNTGVNPETTPGNTRGFDPASVYKTYEDFTSQSERYFVEYFLRDVYENYGYAFHYYDGAPMDEEKAKALAETCESVDGYIYLTEKGSMYSLIKSDSANVTKEGEAVSPEEWAETVERYAKEALERTQKNRLEIAKVLMKYTHFVNGKGQPLHMMPQLQLDPALLEQPIYH